MLQMPTTIFNLSEMDLRNVLKLMYPEESSEFDELDVQKLRSKITEWLLKKGFSTMHNFTKDSDNKWKLPEQSDCGSCGKYKVGNLKG